MRFWTLCVPLAFVAGCASSSPVAAPKFVKRDAAYVRFLNLTDQPLNGSVAGQARDRGIAPGTMSKATIISLSSQKFSLQADSEKAPTAIESKPEPGRYLTVIATVEHGKVALRTVSGGRCLIPAESRLELANFSGKPISCKLGEKNFDLKPDQSESIDLPVGVHRVESGNGFQEVKTASREIWAVVYTSRGGWVVGAPYLIKAPMRPTMQGASPTG